MANPNAPPADVEVTETLIAALLADQFPQFSHLPVRRIDEGWDNVTFRLGEQLAVRAPRRKEAEPLIHHEQTWLKRVTLAENISAPIPIAHGAPSDSYPYPWSVVPWLDGQSCSARSLKADQAERLTRCLLSIHAQVEGAPENPWRGCDLNKRAEMVEQRLHRLRNHPNWYEGNLGDWWDFALKAPISTDHRLIHGDLHPLNILQTGDTHASGTISALIDWGDITSGDVATDLACLWMLFEPSDIRLNTLAVYGADQALIARSRGWGIAFGAILAETGATGDSRHSQIGWSTLMRIAREND